MCNITRKTKRKTADVYKVVLKVSEVTLKETTASYYGIFSLMKIDIGKVISENILSSNIGHLVVGHSSIFSINESRRSIFYKKVSGFARLKDAKILLNFGYPTSTIIKLKISGEIFEGDSTGIGKGFSGNEKTLFGTEVISFKEVKL